MIWLTILFLLTTPLFCSMVFRKRVEEFFLPVLSADILILYFFALFDKLPSGFWVVAAIKIVMIISVVVLLIREPRRNSEALKRFFLTPGILFWVVGIFLAFWLPEGRSFHSWDEFSWWGRCLKIAVEGGSIPLVSRKITSPFLNYPPGTQIATYLFFRVWNVKFSECLCYVCANIIAVSALSTFFRRTQWRNSLLNCALGCALIAAPGYFLLDFYSAILVDYILGIVFAVAAFVAVKDKNDFIDSINLLLICSFLLLIKLSASCLVLFILLLPLGYFIKDLVADLKTHRKIRLATIKGAYRLLPLLSFLISWSWSLAFKHYYARNGAFKVSHITVEKIFEAFHYHCPPTAQAVIENFLPAFFTKPIFEIATCKISVASFALSLFFIILFGILPVHGQSQKRKLLVMSLIMFGGFLIYSFSLMVLYIFVFGTHEGPGLASFRRYESTFLLALTLFTIGVMLYSKRRKLALVLFSLFVFMIPAVWLNYKGKPFVNNIRIPTEIFGQVAKNSCPGKKVLVINQGSSGLENHIIGYQYPDAYSDVISIGIADVGRMYRRKLSLDQMRRMIAKVGLCYLLKTDKALIEQYGELFHDPSAIAPMRLFIFRDGKLAQHPLSKFVCDFEHVSFFHHAVSRGWSFFDSAGHTQNIRLLPKGNIRSRLGRLVINQPVKRVAFQYLMRGDVRLRLLKNGKILATATGQQLYNSRGNITFDLAASDVKIDDIIFEWTSSGTAPAEFIIKNIEIEFLPTFI